VKQSSLSINEYRVCNIVYYCFDEESHKHEYIFWADWNTMDKVCFLVYLQWLK